MRELIFDADKNFLKETKCIAFQARVDVESQDIVNRLMRLVRIAEARQVEITKLRAENEKLTELSINVIHGLDYHALTQPDFKLFSFLQDKGLVSAKDGFVRSIKQSENV